MSLQFISTGHNRPPDVGQKHHRPSQSPSTNTHTIVVTNITTNTHVHYPVLLLLGNCGLSSVDEDDVQQIPHLQTLHEHDDFPAHRSQHQLVRARTSIATFKCLLMLHAGSNRLKLSRLADELSSSSLQLTVHYTPFDGAHVVRLLYIHAVDAVADNAAADEACTRITLAARLVQTLYAEKLPQRRCFQLHGPCRPMRSNSMTQTELHELPEADLWQRLAIELIRTEHQRERRQTEADQRRLHVKYVAIVDGRAAGLGGQGAGDLCLIGAADVGMWPLHLHDVQAAFGSGQTGNEGSTERFYCGTPRSTKSVATDSYATSVGALAHEMGHMFGLGHTAHGLMGDGFDYVARVFAVGVRTVWAPQRRVAAAAASAAADTAATVDRRLTAVRRVTGGERLLGRYREQQDAADDRTWFERCSAAVLAGSRWMRVAGDGAADDRLPELTMDWPERTVRSDGNAAPLRVVELRRGGDAMMLAWWCFGRDDDEERREFRVPDGDVDWSEVAEVFVMDAAGNAKVFYV